MPITCSACSVRITYDKVDVSKTRIIFNQGSRTYVTSSSNVILLNKRYVPNF
jgi:hypothetical protein